MSPSSCPRVALDAMGGDHAPERIVEGAIEAVERSEGEFEVVLTGDESAIRRCDSRGALDGLGIGVIHASETVGMGESAASSARKKPDSSIGVALRQMRERSVDAVVSAGNTGAVVTASLLGLGRTKGVLRPAIASSIPTVNGHCVLLDVGAVADAKPLNLCQFALMGRIYSQSVLGVEKPRVGLLNIGEEPEKGSDLYKQVYRLLQERSAEMNFVGNVEGRDVLGGEVDVVVCDGFTGNVLLKFAESIIGVVTGTLREEVRKSPTARLGALFMKPVFGNLKARLNYEEVGGAPLLGVSGVVVIAHGSSSAKAIRNAVRQGARMAHEGLVTKIGEEFSREQFREEATG